ncbi:hypothetical protein NQZ79_g4682 [Umbelopsis isabellina]|nr:hypothetical protein NQZ79_g4682 [Umbelopsis isabellina]
MGDILKSIVHQKQPILQKHQMAKVYVLGATGGIGTQVVKELLEKGVPTTVLVRDPSKAKTLFGENDKLSVVQGDYSNIDSFKNSIVGHERLFLLVRDIDNMPEIKKQFAQIAYEAGVKQVVDVSSGSVSGPWRASAITTAHYYSEKNIFELPNRGFYVALRPSAFFSNHFFGDHMTVKHKGAIFGAADPDEKASWISTTDIAHLAVNCLTEPVETHADIVYEMTTARLSGNERAAALSNALGKQIKYVQIPFEDAHKNFIEHAHMPHHIVYGVLDGGLMPCPVNKGLSIVLHRKPETLEQWFAANKDAFM